MEVLWTTKGKSLLISLLRKGEANWGIIDTLTLILSPQGRGKEKMAMLPCSVQTLTLTYASPVKGEEKNGVTLDL
jgi:hypothetical protein